jgi:hypothetical protein
MRGQNAYKTVQKTRKVEVTWEIEEQMVRKYVIKIHIKEEGGVHIEAE